MDTKNNIRRRKFLLQIGVAGSAGCGLLSRSSAAPVAPRKTIKVAACPKNLPFLLEETFGPPDAKGSDIYKWLTVLRFEVVKHVNAEGRDALAENLKSDRFEGEVAMTASTHGTSSVEDFSEERWLAVNPNDDRKNIWTQQLNDGNGNQKIIRYDSKPLRISHPIGFKWIARLNDAGQLALEFSDIVKEASELPINANAQPGLAGFQMGLALNPAPEPTSDKAFSVTAHAAAYSAWTPSKNDRAVEIYYNGETPNFKLRRTADLPSVGMGTNRGGIGISYMTATAS